VLFPINVLYKVPPARARKAFAAGRHPNKSLCLATNPLFDVAEEHSEADECGEDDENQRDASGEAVRDIGRSRRNLANHEG